MRVSRTVLYFGSAAAVFFSSMTAAFCPFLQRQSTLYPNIHPQSPSTQSTPRSPRLHDTRLRDRLWERLEIQEDEEPMWYLLNCVAGLEMELLYQCRQACTHLEEDVVKFIVPTEKKTRSHGAKRMVTEHKVKYVGYVFAKLRLCKATYETIYSLDMCRSWMGTVNHKGYKKLPPSPLPLNEDEIASFGLEEWHDDEQDDDARSNNNQDTAILDNGEDETHKPQIDTEAIKSFLGLQVQDMVKVTTRNKFFNEDGVVRRLKDGKIMVRFLTYGTMFEEWLDPADVRKLTDMEAMRGLSGPTQPITQREMDGPARGRDAFDGSANSDFDRQQLGQGPQRNRRQDRVADRFSSGDRFADQQSNNDRNWKNYQDQQQQQRGSNQPWTTGSTTDKDWAMSDVDSQWGRRQTPPRQQRRNERTQNENRKVESALNGDEDWSAFVSSSSSTPKDTSEDDFFASLMSDLKKDLKNNGDKTRSNNRRESPEDNRFFDSLLNDAGTPTTTTSNTPSSQPSFNNRRTGNKDFVSGVKNEKTNRDRSPPRLGESPEDNLFFDSLLDDLDTRMIPEQSSKQTSGSLDDDFFAALQAELEGSLGSHQQNSVDVDARHEKEQQGNKLDTIERVVPADISESSDKVLNKEKKPSSKTIRKPLHTNGSSTETTATSSSSRSDGLSTKTVPVLKEMLRERGLKVSGTKADLIDRLK